MRHAALMTFASPSETESETLSIARCSPLFRRLAASEDDVRPSCSGSSSSPGVFQRFPSIETLTARPLPDGCPPFGPRMPTSCMFRPCRSSRLRRFTPRAPCRSVAPCTRSWGSVRFRLLRRHHLAAAPTISTLPETALHTLQSFPLDYSRTASPRPLPSHRSSTSRMRFPDPKAFLRCRVRCRVRRCRRSRPDALLGFVPLQGSPRILLLRHRSIAKTRRPRLCLVAVVEPPLSFDMYTTCALRRLFRGIR